MSSEGRTTGIESLVCRSQMNTTWKQRSLAWTSSARVDRGKRRSRSWSATTTESRAVSTPGYGRASPRVWTSERSRKESPGSGAERREEDGQGPTKRSECRRC
ncbi:hypothetical protein U1Q18_028351 [Sarracenia purpurea var. burkii]